MSFCERLTRAQTEDSSAALLLSMPVPLPAPRHQEAQGHAPSLSPWKALLAAVDGLGGRNREAAFGRLVLARRAAGDQRRLLPASNVSAPACSFALHRTAQWLCTELHRERFRCADVAVAAPCPPVYECAGRDSAAVWTGCAAPTAVGMLLRLLLALAGRGGDPVCFPGNTMMLFVKTKKRIVSVLQTCAPSCLPPCRFRRRKQTQSPTAQSAWLAGAEARECLHFDGVRGSERHILSLSVSLTNDVACAKLLSDKCWMPTRELHQEGCSCRKEVLQAGSEKESQPNPLPHSFALRQPSCM